MSLVGTRPPTVDEWDKMVSIFDSSFIYLSDTMAIWLD